MKDTNAVVAHVERVQGVWAKKKLPGERKKRRYVKRIKVTFSEPPFLKGKTRWVDVDTAQIKIDYDSIEHCDWISFDGDFDLPSTADLKRTCNDTKEGNIRVVSEPTFVAAPTESILAHIESRTGRNKAKILILEPKRYFFKPRNLTAKSMSNEVVPCRYIRTEANLKDPLSDLVTDSDLTPITPKFRVKVSTGSSGQSSFEGTVKYPEWLAHIWKQMFPTGKGVIQLPRDEWWKIPKLDKKKDYYVDIEIQPDGTIKGSNLRSATSPIEWNPGVDLGIISSVQEHESSIVNTYRPKIGIANASEQMIEGTIYVNIGSPLDHSLIDTWSAKPGSFNLPTWNYSQGIIVDPFGEVFVEFPYYRIPENGKIYRVSYLVTTPGDEIPNNNVVTSYFAVPSPEQQDLNGLTFTPLGTGNTTDHIADLIIENTTDEPIRVRVGPYIIPGYNGEQSYVVPDHGYITIPPRSTVTVPLQGLCNEVDKPPAGNKKPMSPYSTWISPEDVWDQYEHRHPGMEHHTRPLMTTDELDSFSLNPSLAEILFEQNPVISIPIASSDPSAYRGPSDVANEYSITPVIPIGKACIEQSHPLTPYEGAHMETVEDTWIPFGSDNQPLESEPIDTSMEFFPTFPGMSIPYPYKTDFQEDIIAPSPMIFLSAAEGKKSYDEMTMNNTIPPTVFDNDVVKKEGSVKQQEHWVATAAQQRNKYGGPEFNGAMGNKFESAYGMPLNQAHEDIQKAYNKGVHGLFVCITAVGENAKLIQHNQTQEEGSPEATEAVDDTDGKDEEQPPHVTEVVESGCTSDTTLKYNPYSILDMVITDSWSDEEEREKIKASMAAKIAKKGTPVSQDEIKDSYNVDKSPASAWAFWKANHIGGRTAAHAKTQFIKDDWSTDWVWYTEKMDVEAKGSRTMSLSFAHGNECSSFVTGISIGRVHAESDILDPIAGDEDILKAIVFIGDLALDFLKKGKGIKTKKQLLEFIKDQAKGPMEDAIKERTEEEILNIVENTLGIEVKDAWEDYKELKKWATLDIGILDIVPTSSNTYGTAHGKFDITVGAQNKIADAFSAAYYQRKELEDSDEAVTQTGPRSREAVVFDTKPGSLTAILKGSSHMTGQATGNGWGNADLESMSATILFGICNCPDGWIRDAVIDAGYYSIEDRYSEATMKSMGDIVKKINDGLDKGEIAPNQEAVETALRKGVNDWVSSNPIH